MDRTKLNAKQKELVKKWDNLQKRHGKTEPKPYNMREMFEERIPINHKHLGWGFVLSNVNDRLEVLFESGVKNLISNYK